MNKYQFQNVFVEASKTQKRLWWRAFHKKMKHMTLDHDEVRSLVEATSLLRDVSCYIPEARYRKISEEYFENVIELVCESTRNEVVKDV